MWARLLNVNVCCVVVKAFGLYGRVPGIASSTLRDRLPGVFLLLSPSRSKLAPSGSELEVRSLGFLQGVRPPSQSMYNKTAKLDQTLSFLAYSLIVSLVLLKSFSYTSTFRNPSNPSGLSSVKCIPLRSPEDSQLSRKKEAILSKFSEECLKPFPPGNVRKPNKRTLFPRSCQTKPSQSLSQLFDTPSRVVKPMLEAAKTVQIYIEIISEFGLVNRKSQHAGDLPPLTGWNIVRSHELHLIVKVKTVLLPRLMPRTGPPWIYCTFSWTPVLLEKAVASP